MRSSQEEVIRTILAHLDLRSLSSLACVSSTLYKAVKDPLLYTVVNLKVINIFKIPVVQFLKCTSSVIIFCELSFFKTLYYFQPYWPYVNRSTFEWLAGRGQLLQQLDLSWCGAYGKLAASDFNW